MLGGLIVIATRALGGAAVIDSVASARPGARATTVYGPGASHTTRTPRTEIPATSTTALAGDTSIVTGTKPAARSAVDSWCGRSPVHQRGRSPLRSADTSHRSCARVRTPAR